MGGGPSGSNSSTQGLACLVVASLQPAVDFIAGGLLNKERVTAFSLRLNGLNLILDYSILIARVLRVPLSRVACSPSALVYGRDGHCNEHNKRVSGQHYPYCTT